MSTARQCQYCQNEWCYEEEDIEDQDAPPKSERFLKLCSGCRTAWYCCRQHQERDWYAHIFTCKPDKATTAHYLTRAALADLLPDHPQTLEDYGFTRCPPGIEQNYLFGVYRWFILFSHMYHPWTQKSDILSPKKLHKWRIQGVLAAQIKKAHEPLSANGCDTYYTWFLQNQHVLDPSSPPALSLARVSEQQRSILESAKRRAWIFAGGSPRSDDADITRSIQEMYETDRQKADCLTHIIMLLAGFHPGPEQDHWISFGYCTCENSGDEASLAAVYQDLVKQQTFFAIHDAYKNSRLYDLLLACDHWRVKLYYKPFPDGFEDHMATSPTTHKSVWDLKRFIVSYTDDISQLPLSVHTDYGFLHCRTSADSDALCQAYRRYFDSPCRQPMLLHKACVQGQIHEHVNGVVRLKDKRLRTLMRNCYPLKPLGGAADAGDSHPPPSDAGTVHSNHPVPSLNASPAQTIHTMNSTQIPHPPRHKPLLLLPSIPNGPGLASLSSLLNTKSTPPDASDSRAVLQSDCRVTPSSTPSSASADSLCNAASTSKVDMFAERFGDSISTSLAQTLRPANSNLDVTSSRQHLSCVSHVFKLPDNNSLEDGIEQRDDKHESKSRLGRIVSKVFTTRNMLAFVALLHSARSNVMRCFLRQIVRVSSAILGLP
ncbi:hypothetical protein BKA62DRAFT_709510 [Auriculariales sp. MPI-PUGE-AT-0066]|nr:hypothetical protein BKA62DRAFT_709510 [Auriculariales sp. MPI-PUGE-AT-0066]